MLAFSIFNGGRAFAQRIEVPAVARITAVPVNVVPVAFFVSSLGSGVDCFCAAFKTQVHKTLEVGRFGRSYFDAVSGARHHGAFSVLADSGWGGDGTGSGGTISSEPLAVRRYASVRRNLSLVAALSGIVASLPPASEDVFRWLLGEATQKSAVISDFDDTLGKYSDVVPPETVAVLQSLRRAGKRIVVITERTDTKPAGSGVVTILESLSSLPPALRDGMYVGADKGGRLLRYGGSGEARLIYEEPSLTQAEVGHIRAAAAATKEGLKSIGTYLHDGSRNVPAETYDPYGYVMALQIGTAQDRVVAAAELLGGQLATQGFPYKVEPRMPRDPANPPYISLSKVDKSVATRRVAEILNLRSEDALILGDNMLTPRWVKLDTISPELAEAAARAGLDLTKAPARLTGNSTDRNMEKALPGALTISVGGTADPRMANGYVAPGLGPDVTREILRAMASSPPSVR